MLIGYARASKFDGMQVLDLQLDALKKCGVKEGSIYTDREAERYHDLPGLKECLATLKEGDVLVIYKLDRIGRNLMDLVKISDSLIKRKVGLKVLSGKGADIDVTTPDGKKLFIIFEVLSEFEKELICERIKSGIAEARARGRKIGRKRKMDAKKIRFAMSALSNQNPSDVASQLGISTSCMYNYVNRDGSLKEVSKKILYEDLRKNKWGENERAVECRENCSVHTHNISETVTRVDSGKFP